MDSTGPDRQALFDIASEQHGHFTTDQAAQAGYSRPRLTWHVARGNFQRVHRGVYRLRDYPSTPRDDVVAAWLAVGKDVAAVSHESALSLWDMSDVVPDVVHLTVPRAQRSQANRPPPGVVVHTTTYLLSAGDIRTLQGIRVTSPSRTILDAAEKGTQPEQIEMAIAQALARGWVDHSQLQAQAARRSKRLSTLIARATSKAVESGAWPPKVQS